jgi:hypothetical protein
MLNSSSASSAVLAPCELETNGAVSFSWLVALVSPSLIRNLSHCLTLRNAMPLLAALMEAQGG